MLGAAWQFTDFPMLISLEYLWQKRHTACVGAKGTSQIIQCTLTPSFILGWGIEREVIHSGKKAEQRTGQKWDLLIPFPLYVFRVAFNFRLGHQCPYPVGCHFWFAFCALSPFAKDVCLGHIFPGAVMGQHWAHCNFFIISVEQDPAFWKVYP